MNVFRMQRVEGSHEHPSSRAFTWWAGLWILTGLLVAGTSGCATMSVDKDGDGVATEEGDCDDNDSTVYSGAAELCDGKDNNCDQEAEQDKDGDQYLNCEGCGEDVLCGDCDDEDAAVHPGADEVCDGMDDNCDGIGDVDGDGDGSCESDDCDDGAATRFPGNTEICDGIDNNCDGEVDEGWTSPWYLDMDGDGYGDATVSIDACIPPEGYSFVSGDCDDQDPENYPENIETCDGQDNDCDGAIDENPPTWYLDSDKDGHGDPAVTETTCTPSEGYVALGDDCNDADPEVFTGRAESCDGKDNNCDGQIDEGVILSYYLDADNDGHGDSATDVQSCSPLDGYSLLSDDCDDGNPNNYPGNPEVCDGADNDCDGAVGEPDLVDSDGNGLPDACEEEIKMIPVPSGEFVMGSDDTEGSADEWPEHIVSVSAFEIDSVEVTHQAFVYFLNTAASSNTSVEGNELIDLDYVKVQVLKTATGYTWKPGYERHPVAAVTWYGARDFCQRYGKHLPTEAQWEKAARGDCAVGGDPLACDDPEDERTYPWGEAVPNCSLVNYKGCVGDTTEVGSFPSGASPYGVLDMEGNVYEWVSDWYDAGYYGVSPVNDPEGPASGTERVLRSRGYSNPSSDQRVAKRAQDAPTAVYSNVGFRCVR